LGMFILWFGWYGFNAGSTTNGASPALGIIAITTTLSAVGAVFSSMLTSWVLFKKPDTGMTINGALAGLVGITAGCDLIAPGMALVVGLVSGVLVVTSVLFLERILKVDDPVGAVSV